LEFSLEIRKNQIMSFKNKTVIVTGGAKGIGEGCVRVFHRENANVAILDVDTQKGDELSRELGERALFLECDISLEKQVQDTMARVVDEFGGIDVLVNNAGILRYASVTETSEEVWDAILNTNLKGAFFCAKHAIPFMQQREGGIVINMSSAQAFMAQDKVAAYATSKTALLGLTRSIAVDYAPEIRSVAICPGGIDTPLNREAFANSPDPEKTEQATINLHLVQRLGTPEDIGEMALFAASEKGSFLNGHPIRIDGGIGTRIGGSGAD
jgi:NAD(P)-dependent dehydrogenase (short-subunit alcohol dehydrogenase family)